MPEEVWEFRVGGYQAPDKWLKDRKGRTLSYHDIRHYQKVAVAEGNENAAAITADRKLFDRLSGSPFSRIVRLLGSRSG